MKFIKTKKFELVNRGFLNGPFLPIYGSAAMVILLATIPVKDNLVLVFIFGMLGATLMELVTGTVMERLFHVMYQLQTLSIQAPLLLCTRVEKEL